MQTQASQHHCQPSKEHHEKANLAIQALRNQTLKATDSFEAAEMIKQTLAEAEEKRQEKPDTIHAEIMMYTRARREWVC